MTIGLLPVKRGTHLIIDDISGEKIRSDKVKITWEGYVTNRRDWSPKQPQLELRSRSENINVTPTRVRTTDVFVTSVNPDSLNGRL